jgi:titin
LLWTDNAGNEDGFKIERKAGGGGYQEVATVVADSKSYTDTGLSSGTSYYYRVAAYNNGGSSGYSNEASVSTPWGGQTTGQVEITFYVGNQMYLVNGESKLMDVPPIILESRTLLPIRYVAEPLGATVNWDPAAKKVSISQRRRK